MCYFFETWCIGYMGDGFYRSKDATNSIKVLKEKESKGKQPREHKDLCMNLCQCLILRRVLSSCWSLAATRRRSHFTADQLSCKWTLVARCKQFALSIAWQLICVAYLCISMLNNFILSYSQ